LVGGSSAGSKDQSNSSLGVAVDATTDICFGRIPEISQGKLSISTKFAVVHCTLTFEMIHKLPHILVAQLQGRYESIEATFAELCPSQGLHWS
jgi:hypothetical protein